MRWSLASVAALLVAIAFWPEGHAVQGPPALFAQAKSPSLPSANLSRPQSHTSPNLPSPARITTDPPLSSDVGQNPKIEAALEATMEATIEPEPLQDALDWLASYYQIPILTDREALDDAGIKTTSEVKMSVSGLKVRQVLALLLHQSSQPLGYEIQNGVLLITTVEKIREHRTIVVYDCRDLIGLLSPNSAPNVGRAGLTSQGIMDVPIAGLEAGSGPVEKPKQADGGSPGKMSTTNSSRELSPCPQPGNPLIRVIQYAGNADDWHEAEGEVPRITELGGLLVVNQNPIVHEEIKRILADLRRMRREGAFATFEKDHGGSPGASSQAEKKSAGL